MEEVIISAPETAREPAPPKEDEGPHGLYSPYGIGWEAYIKDRLAPELHRCTVDQQDLVFIIMEFKNPKKINDRMFNQFAEGVVNFFTNRDLIFEKGRRGISVIVPNTDLEQGLKQSEIFHEEVLQSLFPNFQKTDLCIGLSSRLERIIDAERLIFETEKALKKALEDPKSPVVAFKSDPVKYRAFIASQKNKKHP
jgi:GGDEF domain-containing protein